MFRLLHLPFVAYKLVTMWADHKSLQVDPIRPRQARKFAPFRRSQSQLMMVLSTISTTPVRSGWQ